ncbi:MAG: DUF4129 domain-containing protein [Pirellulales bacterium]
MAKRLYMSTADYVTIALSPALIMLLVGSLVYFLIEVLYVGEYQARLMYVFALFVFAAVLVSRISIESGSEYAAFFALPLGLATFFVLLKFVEHPGSFSWLINIVLMCVVWWCAHKLTWDCTLIDDEEDSSGEGLLQRVGVGDEAGARDLPAAAENELLAESNDKTPWWKKLAEQKKGKHTPGLWVLYFSLAALPLFGIGQHWIPAAETGRRRYVFSLLLVYVASALALLVTTSFLGLRRYLRQRRIEMPAPMAVNWVGLGAVLIMIVMLLAALLPRPGAEVAISQVPWQITSPGGQSSSRFGQGQDGSDDADKSGGAIREDAPQGDAVRQDGTGEPAESEQGKPTGEPGGKDEQQGDSQQQSGGEQKDSQSSPKDGQQGEQPTENGEVQQGEQGGEQSEAEQQKEEQNQEQQAGRTANTPLPEHSGEKRPFEMPPLPQLGVGLLAGLLKLIFYVVVAVLVAVFLWRNRQALVRAARELLQQLLDLLARLFGRTTTAAAAAEEETKVQRVRLRPFADYRDPFASGDATRLAPEELVRYTFEAFEAWARDAGHSRSPDQTPAELVTLATPPQSPLANEARRMARLYSEAAYADARISPSAAASLRELWSLMRANTVQFAAN